MAGAGAQKDIEVIVKAVRQNGYNVVPAKNGHRKVMLRGKVVTDGDGPLIFSGSTGDIRGRDMSINRMMKAGVLKENPFGGNTKTKAERERNGQGVNGNLHKGNPHLHEEWMREKAREGMRARTERNRLETQKLREDMEPLVVKFGGWEKRGLVQQMAGAVDWYMRSRGWVGMENLTPGGQWCYHALSKIRKGETLAEGVRERLVEFVKDLKSHPDPVARYFEIVRLSKGLEAKDPEANGNGESAVALPIRGGTPLPLPGHDTEHPDAPAERAVAARRVVIEHPVYTVPTLALEAVWRMGRAKGAEYDDVMSLGERILKLELESRGG